MMAGQNTLASLNTEQRLAAEHGIAGPNAACAGPLLIISWKTQTLAHRVVHLIGHGADPTRMLLLSFSRRAAEEMERRVERILSASQASGSMSWSGTFHAIGARLLREYAHSVCLDPAFTIHDPEDSGRPDEFDSPSARVLRTRPEISAEGDLPCYLFEGRQLRANPPRREGVMDG